MWHVTRDMWHVTRDMRHVTHDALHVTCLWGWTFSQNFSSLALTVCDLWYYKDLEEKAHSANEWINHEAVYRTAPATRGLLKIGQSGGASRSAVCYQRNLPCLVSKGIMLSLVSASHNIIEPYNYQLPFNRASF